MRPFAPSHFAVCESKYTLAMLFVFFPVTIVSVSIRLSKYTLAMLFAFNPVTIVLISIGELFKTMSVEFIVFKLAFIVFAASKDFASLDELVAAPMAFTDVSVFLD